VRGGCDTTETLSRDEQLVLAQVVNQAGELSKRAQVRTRLTRSLQHDRITELVIHQQQPESQGSSQSPHSLWFEPSGGPGLTQ
jgi:hypothetical protein